MATAVHGWVSRFLRWPFRVFGARLGPNRTVAATGYNAGKRGHRQNGCSGTHTIIGYLLLAIGYCIRASGENAPELGRLRENNKVPERADYSRRDQTAIDLNF